MDPPAGRKQARMTSGELQVAARTSEFLQFRKQTSGNTGAFLMSPTDLEDFFTKQPDIEQQQEQQQLGVAAAQRRQLCHLLTAPSTLAIDEFSPLVDVKVLFLALQTDSEEKKSGRRQTAQWNSL